MDSFDSLADSNNLWPFPPREGQEAVFNKITSNWEKYDVFCIVAPTACHAKGEKVMLASGVSVPIEDVCIGMELMGPDGTPRKVLNTVSGTADLHRVTPIRGDSFVVTANHEIPVVKYVTLTRHTHRLGKTYTKRYETITAESWYKMSKTARHVRKIYKPEAVRTWGEQQLPIPPYILGVWLGDGTSAKAGITSMDAEVIKEWGEWGASLGLQLKEYGSPGNKASTYDLTTGVMSGGAIRNQALGKLRELGVLNNKHIPRQYLMASYAQRMELLTGLIDTDGNFNKNANGEITQKRKQLAEDILFLVRSLGFAAEIRQKFVKGYEQPYYTVTFSGKVSDIPVKVKRKRAGVDSHKNNKHYGFKIEPVGVGAYYGVTVDKDNLYLMDDWWVTHNCGKSAIATALSNWAFHHHGLPCTTVVPNNLLLKQLVDDYGFATLPPKAHPGFAEAADVYRTSDKRVLNYMALLAHRAYTPVQIWDEGHKIASALQDMEGFRLWQHLTPIPDNIWHPIELIAWAQENRHDKDVDKLYKRVSKSPDEWTMDWDIEEFRGKPRRRLRIYPLTARNNKPIFWPSYWVKKHILMSATISEEDLWDIGLDHKRVLFIEAESPIPEERRPILYEPAGNMSAATQDRDMRKLAIKLEELATRHCGVKGLVHVSYEMSARLQRELRLMPSFKRFVFHDKWDKGAKLRGWLMSPPQDGLILVGAGMAEGLDLKGDKCYWQAITKIMYPNKADLAVAAKMQHRPNYYIWAAAKELMQACGRVCRTPDDFGVTYILTEEWPKFYNAHRGSLFSFWRKAYAKSLENSVVDGAASVYYGGM